MDNIKIKNFIDRFLQMRNSKTVQKINTFLLSPWGISAVGVLTLLAHIFALELVLYTLIVALAVYVSAFGEDLLPILPLFVLCYVSPSGGNNPGKQEGSIFLSGNGAVYLAILLVIGLASIVARVIIDKDIGWKRLLYTKRKLLLGFLALGVAYLLSGIGSEKYVETVWKNLLFALLQFVSIFLLYFLFSVSVKWEKVKKEYFFWSGLVMGLVVLGELLYVYLSNGVIRDGAIERTKIYTGWGIYNNIGAMIALAIPCALYLAVNHKRGYVFIGISVLLLIGVIMSCSRGSIVVAVLVFIIGNVMLAVTTSYKKHMLSLAVIFGAGALIGLLFFSDALAKLFMRVPDIIKPSVDGGFLFNDSNRFQVYKEGLKSYLKFPIFGDSFYPSGYKPWQVGTAEGVTEYLSFFPPRWHNTIIQMLASCGTIGIIAYVFHRVQTVQLVLKKRNVTTAFMVLAIFALLGMSLLDCHMFNIGPAFFYSMALVFLEFLPHEKGEKQEEQEEQAKEEKQEIAQDK